MHGSALGRFELARLPLLDLWRDKATTGQVFHDPDPLVVHRSGTCCDPPAFGTVYYSRAREQYKTRTSQQPATRTPATLDVELMNQLALAQVGEIVLAANPNSLFAGHLVLYPATKRPRLERDDLAVFLALAEAHPTWSFVHNMAGAAASVVDWIHFQAFPVELPLLREELVPVARTPGMSLYRGPDSYPAYAVAVDGSDRGAVVSWLSDVVMLLADGLADGKAFPFNLIASGSRVFVVPRSTRQSSHAATYIGALEMGGLFCLPSAERLRDYLPEKLAGELRAASLADDAEVRSRFESLVTALLRRDA